MARRAGIPKRSMENYFNGQKPGYDALVAIADAFRVPIDWLAGRHELGKAQIEDVVRAAARHEVAFLLESMAKREDAGEPIFREGKVAGRTSIEEYAEHVAEDIVRRTSFLVDYYPDTSRRMFKDDALQGVGVGKTAHTWQIAPQKSLDNSSSKPPHRASVLKPDETALAIPLKSIAFNRLHSSPDAQT